MEYQFSLIRFLCIYALLIVLTITGCETEANSERSEPAAQDDIEMIFDGETLDGWDGDPRFWTVEDSAIVGETTEDNPTEENTFLIWENGEPSDFELTFAYRLVIVGEEGYGNSGIQFRSERFTDEDAPDLQWRVRGYQADFAISDWIPGILYEEGERGVLARRGQQIVIDEDGERQEDRFAEEAELGEYISEHSNWNDYQVYARGDTIRTTINGELMHELIDRSPDSRDEGILAFQLHAGDPMRVEIRDVMLKTLD